MTFLSLPTLILAAALSIPALLLLYFLKLRRQERIISSTLLWRRAVQDLQVNAPFQRLRRNLLLFLQLIVLCSAAFALGEPVSRFFARRDRTLVLLVDQSASMKSREADGTRLDDVRRQAGTFVRNMADSDRAMIITFAGRASVVCPFTSDRRQLLRQLDAIEATDSPSRIGEALQLAVAYSSKIVDVPGATTPLAAAPTANIELFSDGRLADAEEQVVQRGQLRFYPAGRAADNVGIVAIDVRRNYENPGQLSVFARMENFGPAAVTSDVELKLDGRTLSVKEVTLDAAAPEKPAATQAAQPTSTPASQSLAFELTHEAAGLIELRIVRDDALAADNVAYVPIAPPRPLSVLGVSDRDPVRWFLERAVRGVAGTSLTWMTPAEYESAPESKLTDGGRSKFDLVLLDRHDTARLPSGNYVFFGGVPKIEGVSASGETDQENVVYWDETHPLMRYVLLDGVHIAKWRTLNLPRQATRLVEGETSPIVALLAEPGRQSLLLAFDLLDSNFPIRLPFVVFMQNVLRTLPAGGGDLARMLRPGETLTCPVPREASEATILRPDGRSDRVRVGEQIVLTYGRTHEVGVYRVRFDDPQRFTAQYGVNLLDRVESRVAPAERLSIGTQEVAEVSGLERINQALWPYAVGLCLLVLVVEWWIYNRRVMI